MSTITSNMQYGAYYENYSSIIILSFSLIVQHLNFCVHLKRYDQTSLTRLLHFEILREKVFFLSQGKDPLNNLVKLFLGTLHHQGSEPITPLRKCFIAVKERACRLVVSLRFTTSQCSPTVRA